MALETPLYNRVYELQVESNFGNRSWIDLDLEGKVKKSSDITPNHAEINIYNLNPISKRMFTKGSKIKFSAGYEKHKGEIFTGVVDKFSHEKKDLDWVTKIHAIDFGKASQDLYISLSFDKDVNEKQVMEQIAKRLGLSIGKIEIKKPQKFFNGPNFSSHVLNLLYQLQNDHGNLAFVLGGKFYFIPERTTIAQQAVLLNKNTGMIGSPIPTEEGVKVKSLLNHLINPAYAIKVESREINEEFIVTEVIHDFSTFSNKWFSITEGVYRL